MLFRKIVKQVSCLQVALVLFASVGHAALIQAEFGGVVFRTSGPFNGAGPGQLFSGRYSYDDSAIAIGAGPGAFSGGTLYPALSFEINGARVGTDVGIVITDDFEGLGTDGFYVVALDNLSGYPALGLSAAGSSWNGEDLSVMNGRTFQDFSDRFVWGILNFDLPPQPSLAVGGVTSWSQSVIPEPGTGLLMMLGLISLSATRGQRRSRPSRE